MAAASASPAGPPPTMSTSVCASGANVDEEASRRKDLCAQNRAATAARVALMARDKTRRAGPPERLFRPPRAESSDS